MQLLVVLNTTESQLIAMSTVLCEIIHLQNLLLELRGCNFPIPFTKPQVVCHTFEDNATCIEVAQLDHKIRPRTKHISVCLFFTFMITLDRGSSQLSMSRQNISLPILLQNLCPAINACAYMIKLCSGCQLHLLTMRECEVMWDHHLNVFQLPFQSAQYCLKQHCTSYSTCNCFHLLFIYFI